MYMPWMLHADNFYKCLDLNAIAFCLSPNVCVCMFVCNWQREREWNRTQNSKRLSIWKEDKKIVIRQDMNDSWWSVGP